MTPIVYNRFDLLFQLFKDEVIDSNQMCFCADSPKTKGWLMTSIHMEWKD